MNTAQQIDMTATIKTKNMLYQCEHCKRMICGYEPIIHKQFCGNIFTFNK